MTEPKLLLPGNTSDTTLKEATFAQHRLVLTRSELTCVAVPAGSDAGFRHV
eukprot:SAG31_NODE_46440_length_254_cov_1.000000_1_plen_50_part_01